MLGMQDESLQQLGRGGQQLQVINGGNRAVDVIRYSHHDSAFGRGPGERLASNFLVGVWQGLQELEPRQERAVGGMATDGLLLLQQRDQGFADIGELGGGGFGHRRLSAGLVELIQSTVLPQFLQSLWLRSCSHGN